MKNKIQQKIAFESVKDKALEEVEDSDTEDSSRGNNEKNEVSCEIDIDNEIGIDVDSNEDK